MATIQCKGIQRFHRILWCRGPHKLPTLSTGKRSSERMVQTVENILKKCYIRCDTHPPSAWNYYRTANQEGRSKHCCPYQLMQALQPIQGTLRNSRGGDKSTMVTITARKQSQPSNHFTQASRYEFLIARPRSKITRTKIVHNQGNTTEGCYHHTRSHLRPDVTNPCYPE